MPALIPCHHCEELVLAGTCVCPHCGTGGVCRSAGLPAAALLLGLMACNGSNGPIQADYGVAETGFVDNDDDGWTIRDGDCDDDDPDVHPEATETPGDGVDSNCNGNDDD